MNALVFNRKLKFVDDYPSPSPPPGESLIKVLMAGICNTDLEITKGYMGFTGVLGHEFVGVVEKSGRKDLLGRRVVGEINCPCRECYICRKGLGKHCPNRTVLGIQGRDGVFADYITLPDDNLLVVPDNLSDEEATFTEPLAAAFEILESIHIKPTDRVLLLGDGKLGILCAQVVSGTGCDFLVVGKHREKMKILKDRKINTSLLDDFKENISKNDLIKYDVVIECTGNPSGFRMARDMVRPRGTIVQKSTYAQNPDVNISMLVVDEIRLVGSRCGPFKPALSALAKGKIDVNLLIWDILPFGDALSAFEKASRKGAGKVLLKM
ncbi:MAG: alcohol dehydrogenase catalytic domain-containing protein [Candidatus Eremiobacteraeota bacterium]|nr:alcohol dehydrogenase catalytic domain-containing protein [Candidatus Eremiobacteraeota bacterium]